MDCAICEYSLVEKRTRALGISSGRLVRLCIMLVPNREREELLPSLVSLVNQKCYLDRTIYSSGLGDKHNLHLTISGPSSLLVGPSNLSMVAIEKNSSESIAEAMLVS